MKRFRTRYKPIGWRGESHRHYLAAKGIRTRHPLSKQYFAVRNDLKGNRMPRLVAIGHAQGFSDDQLTAERLRQIGLAAGVKDVEGEVQRALGHIAQTNRKRPLPVAPPDEPVDVGVSNEEFQEIPEPELPTVGQDVAEIDTAPIEDGIDSDDNTVETEAAEPGEVNMSPGVPPRSPIGFGSGTNTAGTL